MISAVEFDLLAIAIERPGFRSCKQPGANAAVPIRLRHDKRRNTSHQIPVQEWRRMHADQPNGMGFDLREKHNVLLALIRPHQSLMGGRFIDIAVNLPQESCDYTCIAGRDLTDSHLYGHHTILLERGVGCGTSHFASPSRCRSWYCRKRGSKACMYPRFACISCEQGYASPDSNLAGLRRREEGDLLEVLTILGDKCHEGLLEEIRCDTAGGAYNQCLKSAETHCTFPLPTKPL